MTALKAERKAKERNTKSTPGRGRTLVKAKAAARLVTTDAKARTAAKARAVARLTDPSHQQSKFNSDGSGLKYPDLLFLTSVENIWACQQIVSTDSRTSASE